MAEENEIEEIVEKITSCTLDFFNKNKFKTDTLNSWQSPFHTGKECTFRPLNLSEKNYTLNVSITVHKNNRAIVVNILQTQSSESILIHSFQLNRTNIDAESRDQFAVSLTRIGLLSLPQLFQIRLIRNKIMDFLQVKDFVHLKSTNKHLRHICSSNEVDLYYWRKQLKLKYDMGKEDIHSSYYEAYKHETLKRKNHTDQSSLRVADPLRVHDFLREDRFNPRPARPFIPNPIDPNPFSGPFGMPFGGPQAPFFGGPGIGSEFMPSRPGHGPQPRGPPSMGPSGWQQFDRHDFI